MAIKRFRIRISWQWSYSIGTLIGSVLLLEIFTTFQWLLMFLVLLILRHFKFTTFPNKSSLLQSKITIRFSRHSRTSTSQTPSHPSPETSTTSQPRTVPPSSKKTSNPKPPTRISKTSSKAFQSTPKPSKTTIFTSISCVSFPTSLKRTNSLKLESCSIWLSQVWPARPKSKKTKRFSRRPWSI